MKERLSNITRKQVSEFIINNSLYILLGLFILVVTIMQPRFLSINSIINVLTQTAFRLPIALGIGGIIVLTGTDLSAGRIIGLVAVITASLLQRSDYPSKMFPALGNVPIFGVLILVMFIGGLIGLFNGFFVAKFKLHPFIVTLSTQLIVYAISLQYISLGTNAGKQIGGLRPDFSNAVTGEMFRIFGVKVQFLVLYAVVALIVMWFVWNKTVIGKNMFAVGSNPDAATVSGISVNKTIMIVFLIAGVLYGLNGFLTSAYVGSNNAATGVNFELDAIAACVIGGVSFSGGVGKIKGILLGVFLLQLITVSFVFLGIDANLQYAIKGFVILFATAIDMRKYLVRR
jgi:methyl-galactoside transport system permease protein